MISEYETDEKLNSVTLGNYDVSEILRLPHKLYGFESEYNTLLSAATRVKAGSFELVFLSGGSGTGKTSLAMQLYESIVQQKGFFLYGKYDFSISEPYSALLAAMRSFCEAILRQDKETLSMYKLKIKDAVGEEGNLLTDVISNLHLIIGPQPPVANVSGQDAKHRLFYVFIKFIKSICLANRPITLILDDLQWMDAYSLNLFSFLINERFEYLLIIGTYREDEVSCQHPLAVMLSTFNNRKITNINIKNLNHKTIISMISDTFHISQLDSHALADLVYEKTDGNPLFVKQYLSSLYEEKIIYFNSHKRKWDFDDCLLQKRKPLDNILGLYRRKILSFDESVQEVFKVASCLGSSFSHSVLNVVINRNALIEKAISTGMIVQCEDSSLRVSSTSSERTYRFAHDDIQQVAFSLIPDSDKNTTFMCIGLKLWKLLTGKERDDNIFVIVNLIHSSLDQIISENERTKISELYLNAGVKCLASTAFKDAYKYLKTGISLLSSNCWKTHYTLSLSLHNATAEAAYCIGELNYMSTIINVIIIESVSLLDKEFSHLMSVRFFNDKRMFNEGFNEGFRILEKIGYNLCPNQYEEDLENIKSMLSGKLTQNYVDELKFMSDEVANAAVTILYELLISSYFSNPQMTPIVALRIVQLTLWYGANKYSALGFVYLGDDISIKDPTHKLGYEVADFALLLLKKVPAKEVSPMVFFAFHFLFCPRRDGIQCSLQPFLKLRRKFLEIGSIGSSILCIRAYVANAFHSGRSLEQLEKEIKYLNEDHPYKPVQYSAILQTILNLRYGQPGNPAMLIGTAFDFRNINQGIKNPGEVSWSLAQCIFVSYLFYDYSIASEYIEKCRPLLKKKKIGMYIYSIHVFYDGLVASNMAKQSEDKLMWLKIAESSMLILKEMSEISPENYQNKLYLLQAEMAVAFLDESAALTHFKKAICSSKKYCFQHEEALACERAGMFSLQLESQTLATQFLEQSFDCYYAWGANTKLKHLKSKYPNILSRKFCPLNEFSLQDNSLSSISEIKQ